jgi:UDP-N-acetyl-D-galactosamine dehydrogenase
MINSKKTMGDTKNNESETEFSYFEPRICVIGSGCVGLDLARLFSAKYKTIAFDVDQAHLNELMGGRDTTLAIPAELLQAAQQRGLTCSTDIEQLRHCNFYLVAVPAPEELKSHPEQQPLLKACEILGEVISGGDIVVCESTFCHGVTEDACIPLIEKMSGLTCHIDFFAGSSPRRSNAGDEVHIAEEIRGDSFRRTPEIGKIVDEIYSAVFHHTQFEKPFSFI